MVASSWITRTWHARAHLFPVPLLLASSALDSPWEALPAMSASGRAKVKMLDSTLAHGLRLRARLLLLGQVEVPTNDRGPLRRFLERVRAEPLHRTYGLITQCARAVNVRAL